MQKTSRKENSENELLKFFEKRLNLHPLLSNSRVHSMIFSLRSFLEGR